MMMRLLLTLSLGAAVGCGTLFPSPPSFQCVPHPNTEQAASGMLVCTGTVTVDPSELPGEE